MQRVALHAAEEQTPDHCMTQLVWLPAGMYEDLKEYLNWYDTRRDTKFAADAPVVGLVLQRSHLVTGDEGHYSGVVSELEAQGAKVLPLPPSFHLTSPCLLLVYTTEIGCPCGCWSTDQRHDLCL